VLGAVVFVLLSAVSAMLAFFSSALLVPAAVFAWGNTLAVGLLWLGYCWAACSPIRSAARAGHRASRSAAFAYL
jgi:hypothetical protein